MNSGKEQSCERGYEKDEKEMTETEWMRKKSVKEKSSERKRI